MSIAELEERALLDFGTKVRAADTHAGGERRIVRTLGELLDGSRNPRRRRK